VASNEKTEKPAEGVESVELDAFVPGNWEFIDKTPTTEEVAALLSTLPPWWGVHAKDFADYVQGLPSNKKTKVQQPKQRGEGMITVDVTRSVVTLYFSVAGRIQMLRTAQELNGWKVEFEPEPKTPTGIPGYLSWENRLVYRVHVRIWAPLTSEMPTDEERVPGTMWTRDDGYVLLGDRTGTAWVPATGGKQAAGSNPYEKVETSALGRALAAWGFGVLPGSGVASLEEMRGVPQNRAGMDAEAENGEARAESEKLDPQELAEQVMRAAEAARQLVAPDDEQWGMRMVHRHLKENQGVNVATQVDQDGSVLEIDLSLAKPAALALARNAIAHRISELKADQTRKEMESGGA
jgi:hypothetical protein